MTEEIRVFPLNPRYEVSSMGRVRRSGSSKWLSPGLGGVGYLTVSLFSEGHPRGKSFAVHRLVAITFLGAPPSPQHQVAHIDGCKTNNTVENLRWATPQENNADKVRHGTIRRGERNPVAKLTEQAVRAIHDQARNEGVAIDLLAAEYGVSEACVYAIASERRWGHLWQ